jgi:alpha-beta hydrolase superfamily lysophospholipase
MRPAYVIEIVTPKKFVLNGLWFGPRKPKRVIVWVHGLGSSIFSKLHISDKLIDRDTAVLVFNNRGFERVAHIRRLSSDKKKERLIAGASHEIFKDCVDDIQGAINFAKKSGARSIYLAGHSTGCQKSIYWASKGGKGVRGIILLAPVSDYAGALANHGAAKIARAASFARSLMRKGKPHDMIPSSLWSEEPDDAQRFLSLYTPESVEEIFSYVQLKKRPRTLESVKIPILVIWADRDEFSDRPARQIATWFEQHIQKGRVEVIPNVGHGFKGGEVRVATTIRNWLNSV